MTETRFDLFGSELMTGFVRRFQGASRVVTESTLPPTVQELVKVRASQVNGCGMCIDMHVKDALAAGEDQTRLFLVAAWRDATVFTEAERAALALAEEGTRLADASTGVSEETWQAVRKHYDDEQVAALIAIIAVINAWNRLNVIAGTPAGGYQPGMFG
ncbi:carboxymuconolactone decarboxylase family protein [Nocardioides sp. MAH-18]|uniref:Carboxymuconolactone decarboxylase family protein n=1 Tax=Nocardioides agri TaxID=2682843 RepID=A0A6L6XVZ2_9ACTN|nr:MULTISPECIES: carboxymuconolactone decarboxylase family protein [unclassified Nocardioides]MBA2952183.1 carboxymuconolactone decarboxylase family protein [Nocardioides sp. CGMCC 1.13656]MVQ51349.1 carboxymuconolactone decarboxylase family protein [Nocardioides sp. MAH-18]